jgi:hypothetical protein
MAGINPIKLSSRHTRKFLCIPIPKIPAPAVLRHRIVTAPYVDPLAIEDIVKISLANATFVSFAGFFAHLVTRILPICA